MNHSQTTDEWFVIVNPVAGQGRGLKDWPIISTLLTENNIDYKARFTLRKHHATELAFWAINNGYRQIVVVGGDGTIHEVVCGVFYQKLIKPSQCVLAVIPVGTGNDLIKMFGIATSYSESIKAIVNGYSFMQDVGQMSFYESKVNQVRYMANSSSIGFSAAVCRKFNTLREKGYYGKALYAWAALLMAFRYKNRRASVILDGKTVFCNELFSIAISIGKYTGGGMSQTPYAIADDGLFDVTIVPKKNRFRLFTRFKALYTGNIYNITGISMYRAKHVQIISELETELEIDGESTYCSDFDFNIQSRSIRVIVSEKFLKESNIF